MRPLSSTLLLLALAAPALHVHAAKPEGVKPITADDIARLNKALAEPSDKFDTPARVVEAYVPIYPISRLLSGRTGTCKVEMAIGADGKPAKLEPDPEADKKMCAHALHALKYWKFEPATKDGSYVETRFRMPFHYNIE